MAAVIVDGTTHRFAGNPVLQGEVWSDEFPAIVTTAQYLRNKSTGEIVPNFPEFAERSDILEPYFGDPAGKSSATTSTTVPEIGTTLEVLASL